MDNERIENFNSISLENRIRGLIKKLEPYREIEAYQSEFGLLHPEEGHILQMLIEISNAKSVLEIGTSIGVSALWMSLGLLKTGGKLISIELYPEHAQLAKENFKKVGRDIENIITTLEGDALKVIPTLKEKFDFVFSDALKIQNLAYFGLFMPLVIEGGLIVAHDAVYEVDNMRDYLTIVENHPQLNTVIIATPNSQTGMVISYKKVNSDTKLRVF